MNIEREVKNMKELKENELFEVSAEKLSDNDVMESDWIKFFKDYEEAKAYANKLHNNLKFYGWSVVIDLVELNDDPTDNFDNELLDRVLEIRSDQ